MFWIFGAIFISNEIKFCIGIWIKIKWEKKKVICIKQFPKIPKIINKTPKLCLHMNYALQCKFIYFSNFSCIFLNHNIFSNFNSYCSNLSYLRNLQGQIKKGFFSQKLFWPFIVRANFFSDLKIFANSRMKAENFKSFFRSLRHFFLTVGQNNFGNKIPFLTSCSKMSSRK